LKGLASKVARAAQRKAKRIMIDLEEKPYMLSFTQTS